MFDFCIAPARGLTVNQKPWEGCCEIKPWEYKVTAAIPVLDTWEQLELVIELLRLQTVRPYIVVIDTGSTEYNLKKIEEFRSKDLEVHSIRMNGTQHPSDFPAIAMDLAFSLCRTEYIFATHSDCFLKKRDYIEYVLHLAKTKSPVVGYEISPRSHKDWKGMVSHTATIYHMPTMDNIGAGWSLRRLCHIYNRPELRKPNAKYKSWPDTEILIGYILRYHNIKPYLIGHETNYERNVNENLDHPRTYISSKLYSEKYFRRCSQWMEEAMSDAKERIEKWKSTNSTCL